MPEDKEKKKKVKKPEKEVEKLEKPEKEPTLPKKPDEKSHPDPLKRFKALKEWRKVVNKITGEEEIMKWKPEKTFATAEKEVDKKREEHKLAEPKRSDFPKGVVGSIKFKVAYKGWLEKTL